MIREMWEQVQSISGDAYKRIIGPKQKKALWLRGGGAHVASG